MRLWTTHRVYQQLGASVRERTKVYRELFRGHLDDGQLREIRQATQQGMVLGGDRFKQEVERLAGRRATTLTRGPKPKHKGNGEFLL